MLEQSGPFIPFMHVNIKNLFLFASIPLTWLLCKLKLNFSELTTKATRDLLSVISLVILLFYIYYFCAKILSSIYSAIGSCWFSFPNISSSRLCSIQSISAFSILCSCIIDFPAVKFKFFPFSAVLIRIGSKSCFFIGAAIKNAADFIFETYFKDSSLLFSSLFAPTVFRIPW